MSLPNRCISCRIKQILKKISRWYPPGRTADPISEDNESAINHQVQKSLSSPTYPVQKNKSDMKMEFKPKKRKRIDIPLDQQDIQEYKSFVTEPPYNKKQFGYFVNRIRVLKSKISCSCT